MKPAIVLGFISSLLSLTKGNQVNLPVIPLISAKSPFRSSVFIKFSRRRSLRYLYAHSWFCVWFLLSGVSDRRFLRGINLSKKTVSLFWLSSLLLFSFLIKTLFYINIRHCLTKLCQQFDCGSD